MELIPGVSKENYSDHVLYFIEDLSDELKMEKNRKFEKPVISGLKAYERI